MKREGMEQLCLDDDSEADWRARLEVDGHLTIVAFGRDKHGNWDERDGVQRPVVLPPAAVAKLTDLLAARPLPGVAQTDDALVSTLHLLGAVVLAAGGEVRVSRSALANIHRATLHKRDDLETGDLVYWVSAPRDGGSAAPAGGTAHDMPEVIVCRDCGTARAGRVLVCACGSASWREPAPTVETGEASDSWQCPGCGQYAGHAPGCSQDVEGAPSQPPAPRYFTCRCTRDHGATGCSVTGSSVSGGLCAWCAAEHRTTPDVKGALAWLWSAYGLAGGARGDIRRAMAMLGDNPPEEDESPPATGLPCDTLEGAEACEECNGGPGLTDETKE